MSQKSTTPPHTPPQSHLSHTVTQLQLQNSHPCSETIKSQVGLANHKTINTKMSSVVWGDVYMMTSPDTVITLALSTCHSSLIGLSSDTFGLSTALRIPFHTELIYQSAMRQN